ncbi:zinc finger protein, putative [Bodo saltans]|uniref:Zinc finger protein, putative n=1 Tax=Bodo saltans TaxID=75058 RepID=A0A0S4JR88_BODSA|nr:zinc finger protein, putative [Bodo saltans]|eukprot:CUG91838.1 zinc finger protein, putative [Bodo saltans]
MKFVPSINNTSLFEVFDPQFKYVKEIPASLIRHLPPARLNITRLVFCRNYVPGQAESCNMGDGCKFVHADVDAESLESHPIHVKYSWRHEDVCTYARLPAGDVLRVTAPNNRPPVEEIASERVLVTRGSLRYRNPEAVHYHCMHYHQHRMCNRGERCNFIHVVHVDPNVVGDFKRAPAVQVVVDAEVMDVLPDSGRRSSLDTEGPQTVGATMSADGCVTPRVDLTKDDEPLSKQSLCVKATACSVASRAFHHNPYCPQSAFRTWVS